MFCEGAVEAKDRKYFTTLTPCASAFWDKGQNKVLGCGKYPFGPWLRHGEVIHSLRYIVVRFWHALIQCYRCVTNGWRCNKLLIWVHFQESPWDHRACRQKRFAIKLINTFLWKIQKMQYKFTIIICLSYEKFLHALFTCKRYVRM